MRSNWIDAELTFRRALQLQTETLSQNEHMVVDLYIPVGYFKKIRDILAILFKLSIPYESFLNKK